MGGVRETFATHSLHAPPPAKLSATFTFTRVYCVVTSKTAPLLEITWNKALRIIDRRPATVCDGRARARVTGLAAVSATNNACHVFQEARESQLAHTQVFSATSTTFVSSIQNSERV